MRLRFTKMQGAGNDFVMLNGVERPLALTPERIRALADRRFGVGADQILVVERPTETGADFRYRIFNADGGEVEQCGNGARCFVVFVRHEGLTDRSSIRVQTAGGMIEPHLLENGNVSVDMGVPSFAPAASGFSTQGLNGRREGSAELWPLPIGGRDVWVSVVSMGNPHAVQEVRDVDNAPVLADGPAIERHARFAAGVNAGFMQVMDAHTIRLRVWERGTGETAACGTGACAAVVSGIRRGVLASPVEVHTRGGRLNIRWDGTDGTDAAHVFLAGPAVKVFEGEIDIE